MSKFLKYLFLFFVCPVFGQAVVFTSGVNYTSGAPTHNPGKTNSRIAIDTVTWLRYEHVVGTTWTATGYAWQEHSGCSAPSGAPTKHQSIYKTNTCSPPKMYKWTGAAWEEMGYGTGVVITANNGLYKPTTSSVRAGGPFVENTNMNGKATYTLTLDSMYLVTIKANRTSGTGASRITMGSSNAIGVDILHYNPADLDNIGQITANFNTGNIMSLANGSLITSFTQYLSGGNYRSEWYASNGSISRIMGLGYNDFSIQYLDRQTIADETAIATWDSLTGKFYYQSPDIMATALHQPDSTFAKGSIGTPSYSGKTLGGNVFRKGRTGFKTTNTTGVVNISPGFETGVPAISIPDSCERVLQIAADSRGDSLGAFVFHNRWFDNASEVGDNQVAIIGYNTTPGGGKIESGKAGASLRIEEKYDIATDGNKKPSFEFHLPQINFKTGTGTIRPLTGIFGHEQRFGGRWQFAADDITFLDYKTGTQKAIWGFATNGYTKGIDFQDTAQLRFQVNNWNIFSQKKAGSGFVDVIKVNASDEILIGGGGETRTAIYNHLRLTNGGILSNENGEIYIGNTANPTRVILENNTSNLLTLSRTGASYTNTFSIFGDQFYYQSSSGTTPFKVFLGAPSNSLLVNGSGFVGIGQGSPTAQLHVFSSAGTSTTKMFSIGNLAGTASFFRTNVTPQSAVTGNPSDFALSNIAGAGSAYIKKTGTGNTGWGEVLTNDAGASGTTSYLPKFTSGNTIGNSAIYDDGSASIIYPWSYGAKIQFSGSYYMGMRRGSGRDLELYAVSADNDADITLKPGGGVALTAKNDGKVGIGTTSPAQTFHVAGTARITGSDGTATGLMGRDGDGDVSGVGIGIGLELSGASIQADMGSGVNISGNSISWGGTLTENTTIDFDTYDVSFTDMPTSTTEDEALVIDSGTGKLARGQIPYTALRNPGEATYLGDNGATGETVTWQPEDILVEADPTAGHLTVELNTSMKQGLAYSLFGCCNATYDIIISASTIKLSGSYGTTTTYTLGAGEHLEVIRMSTNTFYVSKK